jgi:hypothetical protein
VLAILHGTDLAPFHFPDLGRLRQPIDILVIGVCCLDCGGAGFTDMETLGLAQRPWLGTVLELPNGIPSHDTHSRVFAAMPLEKIAAGQAPPDAVLGA